MQSNPPYGLLFIADSLPWRDKTDRISVKKNFYDICSTEYGHRKLSLELRG